MSVVPNKPIQRDPYLTLGLSHDATSSQIKATYRKLALQYHPDRQNSQKPGEDEHIKTDKFVEIAAAYAVLSDPTRKKEYDHLYKFGAFDSEHNGETSASSTSSMNYKYTENYSGGYYTKSDGTKPQHQQSSAPAPFYRSVSTASNDSFFDELINSPGSKKNTFEGVSQPANGNVTNSDRANKKGIGFSFAPLGKHLSVHVPSRNEIVMGMARGERMHNFGTRVTFSTQKVEAEPIHTQTNCAPFLCAESESSSKTFVSTTTRIAKGRHRVVKRTATLRPDGKKEVVIEEDGVVIRQYVEDMCKDDQQSSANSENGDGDNKLNDNSEDGHWYSDLIRGMQSSLCFAPCSPMLATVAEQDI